MPRIVMNDVPAFCDSTRLTLGDCATKSIGFWMRASLISLVEKTLALIGTSIKFSARMRAVTTISSRSAEPESAAKTILGGVSANARTPRHVNRDRAGGRRFLATNRLRLPEERQSAPAIQIAKRRAPTSGVSECLLIIVPSLICDP